MRLLTKERLLQGGYGKGVGGGGRHTQGRRGKWPLNGGSRQGRVSFHQARGGLGREKETGKGDRVGLGGKGREPRKGLKKNRQ